MAKKRENPDERVVPVYFNVGRSQDRATYEKIMELPRSEKQDKLREALYVKLHGYGIKKAEPSADLSQVNKKLDYLIQAVGQNVPIEDLMQQIDAIDGMIADAQAQIREFWIID